MVPNQPKAREKGAEHDDYRVVIIIRVSSKLRGWIPKPENCKNARLGHREEAEKFYRNSRRKE